MISSVKMEAFLGKRFFPGSFVNQDAARASWLARARFHGHIILMHWQRAEVERVLPAELALATNNSSTPDLHPVIFFFGALADTATIFAGITVPAVFTWTEFVAAIPFVTHRRGRYLHTYIPRIYSSYFPPLWHGNAHFGFSKQMASMRWHGPMFVLTSEDEVLLVHAVIESTPTCNLSHFDTMREVFALPIVGRKATGEYVCSYFDWNFSDALVRPADSWISIDAPLVDGLTPRVCYDVDAGTFDVRGMLWQLSWPLAYRF